MSKTNDRIQTNWAVPVVAVLAGIAYLMAGLVGGNPRFGVIGLAIMLAFAAVFLAAGRFSETARGLRDRRDERINSLDRDATLFAGGVLMLAVIAMFVVEIARGNEGSPYYQLAALAGGAYLVALVWLRFRR